MNADAFRPDFDARGAADALARDGFWIAEGAVRRHVLDEIEGDLRRPVPVNVNDVGPVVYHAQTYFTHGLAASRAYFDLVTHPQLRAIARAVLGPHFRLKCQRYVVNRTGFALSWHTDNKTSVGVRTEVHGVGVVIYTRDCYEGELQVVRGSHRWTLATGETEFDASIARDHATDVVTISARAGTIIFFDTMTAHRTRPITLPHHERPSIFLQIDADLAHSERIVINTEFADPSDAELMRYLGMGMSSGYPLMPPTDTGTLGDRELVEVAGRAAVTLAKRHLPAPLVRTLARVRRSLP